MAAIYEDDGNPFGGHLVEVRDSTWDTPLDPLWNRTDVRELRGARRERVNAQTAGLDPDPAHTGSEPGMSMPSAPHASASPESVS